MKNISVLFPQSVFSREQLVKINFAGQATFLDENKEVSLEELVKVSRKADIIAFPAESSGKSASKWLRTILEKSPSIKAVALDTTHTDFVDKDYCVKNGISVTTVPDICTAESEAEFVMASVLNCARKILINDRRTYRRSYQPERGVELRGKTIGIVNVDAVGERVATLAKAFGMTVLLYNETFFPMEGMRRAALNQLITESDFLTIHLKETRENRWFLSEVLISRLKEGCSVINLASRMLVDESAMSKALLSKQVSSYVIEAESLIHSPLKDIETAIMLKPFSKLTVDSQMRKMEWLAKNTAGLAVGRPHNPVDLSEYAID